MTLTFAFMLNGQFYFIILHNKSGADRGIPLLFCTHVGVTLRKPNMCQMTVDCGSSYRSCSLHNKEIVILPIKEAMRWKVAVFWPKYHSSFPFRCIQRASSKQLLLFRQAVTLRRKLVIGLTFVCTFSAVEGQGQHLLLHFCLTTVVT